MPPTHTDAIVSRLSSEIEERSAFIDGLVEAAEREKRDLTGEEISLVTRARERIEAVGKQIEPLQDASRIARESRDRTRQISEEIAANGPGLPTSGVEYRSAGAFVLDFWKAGLGIEEAVARQEVFKRAAAHQTTADNPGLLPEQILGPVINFVDAARPLVAALGPRQLPGGSWSRPVVTQHTNVAKQTDGEKTELVSRKMIINKIPVSASTFGGYVNISRQDIDWSSPSAMDIVINDLASRYSEETEIEAATVFMAAATAGPSLGATPTPAEVAAALWTAAGTAYAATRGAGRLVVAVSPDMLGVVGPLFAPINPVNTQSTGFQAGSFGSGAVGAISGMSVVMSPGLASGSMLVLTTAAAEVYEDRIGSLQVVEPSVLGVQVAYAGYFAPLVIEDGGLIKIT